METAAAPIRLKTETISHWGTTMNRFSKIATAVAIAATTATTFTVPADARTRRHHYYGRTTYRHKVCRYSRGNTGAVVGGVAGAVAGPSIIGHGLLGAAAGAVGGVVAGRAIDRATTSHRRCYYTR
jgi:outer membrane lipoprotein SlyB